MNIIETPSAAVVLLSGGIDSLVLAERERRAGRLKGLVFIDYGHPAQVKEGWKAFNYHGTTGVPLKVIHVFGLDLGPMQIANGSCIVPSRNLILLAAASNAAASMEATGLLIGATGEDQSEYDDCKAENLQALSAAFVACGGLPIYAPFAEMSKMQIVQQAADYGFTQADAWSCYKNQDKPCGVCNSCKEAAASWARVRPREQIRWAR